LRSRGRGGRHGCKALPGQPSATATEEKSVCTVVNFEAAREEWGRERIKRYLTAYAYGEPEDDVRCAWVVILATALQCGFDMEATKEAFAEAEASAERRKAKATAKAKAAAEAEGGPAA
jgi:hypothetical protein